MSDCPLTLLVFQSQRHYQLCKSDDIMFLCLWGLTAVHVLYKWTHGGSADMSKAINTYCFILFCFKIMVNYFNFRTFHKELKNWSGFYDLH